MTERRFYALCGLVAAGVYAGMVTAVAALCGLPGVIVAGLASVIITFIVKGVA